MTTNIVTNIQNMTQVNEFSVYSNSGIFDEKSHTDEQLFDLHKLKHEAFMENESLKQHRGFQCDTTETKSQTFYKNIIQMKQERRHFVPPGELDQSISTIVHQNETSSASSFEYPSDDHSAALEKDHFRTPAFPMMDEDTS